MTARGGRSGRCGRSLAMVVAIACTGFQPRLLHAQQPSPPARPVTPAPGLPAENTQEQQLENIRRGLKERQAEQLRKLEEQLREEQRKAEAQRQAEERRKAEEQLPRAEEHRIVEDVSRVQTASQTRVISIALVVVACAAVGFAIYWISRRRTAWRAVNPIPDARAQLQEADALRILAARVDPTNHSDAQPSPPAKEQTVVSAVPLAGTAERQAKLFLSYRRDDSADVTGRIYDRLVQHFGKEQVFKDVDSIPFGVDFRAHLQSRVNECKILLVVIGDRWIAGKGTASRLHDQKDYVRIELEAALNKSIPVIPVLVRGASIPDESDLPPALGSLSYRNGLAVRPDPDFHRDMDRLIEGISSHLKHAS